MIRTVWPAACMAATVLVSPLMAVAPAQAAGDLLVAPTRVVLDGARGTEVIVNNIGSETATYRISLVVRRMKPDGSFEEVEETAANEREVKTLGMISYAPRRVTLPPNQPQAVRVGVRPPEGLEDGEYRAHLLIRAIPDAKTPTQTTNAGKGLTISITPIYGITIPVIVRKGQLVAQAAILDPHVAQTPDGPAFKLQLTRTGTKSTYGRIRVTRPGVAEPLYEARGIAVYAETAQRDVILPIPAELAPKLRGPATVEYLEDNPADGGVIATFKGVIR